MIEETGNLDLEVIRKRCHASEVRYSKSVDSTNDWARRERLDVDCSGPTLFLAEQQTKGRGRRERKWYSSEGSVMFSLLIPDPPRNRVQLLPMASAAGVCMALESDTVRPFVKWPNDVILSNRKLAGILVEGAGLSEWAIIGVGLNANNEVFDSSQAIALIDEVGSPVCLTTTLIEVVNSVLDCCRRLPSDSEQVMQYVQGRDWLLGKSVVWSDGQQEYVGVACGMRSDGALQLQVAGKRSPLTVHSGTVRVLPGFEP